MLPDRSTRDFLDDSQKAMRLVEEHQALFLKLVANGASIHEVERAREKLALVRALADATMERLVAQLKSR